MYVTGDTVWNMAYDGDSNLPAKQGYHINCIEYDTCFWNGSGRLRKLSGFIVGCEKSVGGLIFELA